MHRTPHGVVRRVDQQLVIGGGGNALGDLKGVVGFDDAFGAIGEVAVADQDTEATGTY